MQAIELRDRMLQYLGRPDDPTIPVRTLLLLCEAEFNRRLRCVQMEKSTVIVLDEGQTEATLPDDFLQAREVTLIGEPNRVLEYVTPARLDTIGTQGCQLYYSIQGHKIRFAPHSNAATALTLNTRASPPPGFQAGQLVFQETFRSKTLNQIIWHPWVGDDRYGRWSNLGTLEEPFFSSNFDGITEPPDIAFGDPYPYGHDVNTSGQRMVGGNGLFMTASPHGAFAQYGPKYGSAGISTYNKMYLPESCFIQIKAKLCDMRWGAWPSFYLIGKYTEGGPELPEIDIFEGGYNKAGVANVNRNISVNFHAPGAEQKVVDAGVLLNQDYHTYGCEIRAGESIRMYVDNLLVAEYKKDVPQHPEYFLILHLEVAGQAALGWRSVASPTNRPGPYTMHIESVEIYDSSIVIPPPGSIKVDYWSRIPALQNGTYKIEDVDIEAGGEGYHPGDLLVVLGGSGDPCRFIVEEVNEPKTGAWFAPFDNIADYRPLSFGQRDFQDLFNLPAQWPLMVDKTGVFKLYTQCVDQATDDQLARIFGFLQGYGIDLSMESWGLHIGQYRDPTNACGLDPATGLQIFGYLPNAHQDSPALWSQKIKRCGGDLKYLALDHAFTANRDPRGCHLSPRAAALDVESVLSQYRVDHPNVRLVDCISLPTDNNDPSYFQEWASWCDAITEVTGQPFAQVQLDVHWEIPTWYHSINAFNAQVLKPRGIPLGILFFAQWGQGSTEAWLNLARTNMDAYRTLGMPKNHIPIIQNFEMFPDHAMPEVGEPSAVGHLSLMKYWFDTNITQPEKPVGEIKKVRVVNSGSYRMLPEANNPLPVFSQTGTGTGATMTFKASDVAIDDPGVSSNWLLTESPELYTYALLSEGELYLGSQRWETRYQIAGQKKEIAYSSLTESDRKTRHGSAPLRMRTRGP